MLIKGEQDVYILLKPSKQYFTCPVMKMPPSPVMAPGRVLC